MRLRLNIGPRLALCFVSIVASMLCGDAAVLWQFHVVRIQTEHLNSYDQELVALLRVHSDLLAFHASLESSANDKDIARLISDGESATAKFVTDAQAVQHVIQTQPSGLLSDTTIVPTLAVVDTAFRSQFASIVGLAKRGDWSAVQLRLDNQIRSLEASTAALVEKVDREASAAQQEAAQNIRRVQQRVFVLVPITIVLTLLIAATLGFAITRSITQPLEQLVEGSKMLARGDFHHQVAIHREDELAHVGRVFNKTARQLQELYGRLQDSENRLRRVIDTIPAHVWSTLPDGAVDFINQRLLESTGLPVEALLGSGWQSIVHPDDSTRFITQWRSALILGEPVEIEARIWTSRKDYRWLLIRNVPLRDTAGNITKWYGTGIDIEDRKNAEEELRKAQAELAHANRVTTMGELSASLAHEINQPITGVLMNASTCLRWLKREQPDLEEARSAVSRIIRDANRAAEIVSRVKLFFQKGVLTKEVLDVNDVIREMELLLRNQAHQHSVSIRTELGQDLPFIEADRVQLQQVLMNLMVNGIEAMKDVEGPRQLTVQSQHGDAKEVLLSVQDTGIGLPKRRENEIFNAFFTTKEHGTGMGLRISRTIVEAHGGKLWATGNHPRGASFHLTIGVDPRSESQSRMRIKDAQ
jgi:PAS domain S-box-containing protein